MEIAEQERTFFFLISHRKTTEKKKTTITITEWLNLETIVPGAGDAHAQAEAGAWPLRHCFPHLVSID